MKIQRKIFSFIFSLFEFFTIRQKYLLFFFIFLTFIGSFSEILSVSSTLLFAELIIKNSKVRLIQVEDEIQLKKFIRQNTFGEKIYIGMGAGTISNWMRNLKNIF